MLFVRRILLTASLFIVALMAMSQTPKFIRDFQKPSQGEHWRKVRGDGKYAGRLSTLFFRHGYGISRDECYEDFQLVDSDNNVLCSVSPYFEFDAPLYPNHHECWIQRIDPFKYGYSTCWISSSTNLLFRGLIDRNGNIVLVANDNDTILFSKDDKYVMAYANKWFLNRKENVYRYGYEIAFECYKYLAKKGNSLAQYAVGWMCQYGMGTKTDWGKASVWYRKSNEPDAKKQLALIDDNSVEPYPEPSPKPEPMPSFAEIVWLSPVTPTTEKEYTLEVGVKNSSKIESWKVFLNGADVTNERGVNPIKVDGFQMKIKKKLTLTKGDNTIRIEIVNSKGKTDSEKVVKCLSKEDVVNEKRLALVIGNASYRSSCFQPLRNALNDAEVMYEKLKTLGFDLCPLVLDADKAKMWNAIEEFVNKVDKGNYDVALLYYSGHGLSPDGGANYLIPIDAKVRYLDEIKRDGINSQTQLIAKLEDKRCRVKIALLDCCNNCNVPEREAKSISYHGGLALTRPPYGMSIVHAAQPRKTALDGIGNSKNSPFVEAFIDCLTKYSNYRWASFLEELTNTVERNTNGRQIPYYEGQLRGKPFYLNPKMK